MSLISDALKIAQREKSGRSQSARDQQPLIDGFFPYAATPRPRSRSKVIPIVAISGGVVALIVVTGWLMLSKPAPRPAGSRVPIVLPPPVTIAQTPARPDSSVVSANAQTSPIGQEQAAEPAVVSENRQASATRQPATEKRVALGSVSGTQTSGVVTPRAVDTTSSGVARAPIRVSSGAAQVDYEAKATVLFNAGDLEGARENFALATRYAPSARAWTNYGVTLQRLGDYAGAAAAYRAAVGVDANYLEAWLYQARLASEMKDVAKAIPLLQRALAINPHHADANIEMARLESEAKNWTDTRKFAEEAVRSDPTNARGQWYFAVSSDQLKDNDAAIRGYTAYLQYVTLGERDQEQFVGWARSRLAELRGRP